MPIALSCRCGRSFQAKDEQVGKSAHCPACGAKHFVPSNDSIVPEPQGRQQPKPQPSPSSQSTTQKMFPCSVCGCKFLPSQVYDDRGKIICHGCWDADDDDDDGDYDDDDTDQETGIEVKASFFPLFWTMFLFQVELRIDGKRHTLSWFQTKFFPLRPGKHRIMMTVNMLFGPWGTETRTINLKPDQLKVVHYYHSRWWASMNVWER